MAYSKYYKRQLPPEAANAYEPLVQALAQMLECFDLPSFPREQMEDLVWAVRFDYPELCYVDYENLMFSFYPDRVRVTMTYRMTREEAKMQQVRIEAVVTEILRKGEPLPPESKERYFHDALLRRAVYATNPERPWDAHNIVGPFLDGECVCEGYAKAFQYLADRAKLPCITVVGDAHHPDGSSGGHAWNLVQLDGKNYHVDVTFDQLLSKQFCSRAYFNLSTAEISTDHSISPRFPIPDCPDSGALISRVDTPEALMNFLRKEADRHMASSEVLFGGELVGIKPGQVIFEHLKPEDHGWYSRIKRICYSEGCRSVFIEW